MRKEWQQTYIGDPDFCDTEIAEDNGRYLIRYISRASKENKQNIEFDEARQNGPLSYRYGDEQKTPEFVDNILVNSSNALQSVLNRMKGNQYKLANVNELVASSLENLKRVEPISLTITGHGDDIIMFYELAQQY